MNSRRGRRARETDRSSPPLPPASPVSPANLPKTIGFPVASCPSALCPRPYENWGLSPAGPTIRFHRDAGCRRSDLQANLDIDLHIRTTIHVLRVRAKSTSRHHQEVPLDTT